MIDPVKTMSLCEECYRHIPATRFKRDRALWIHKVCPEHGEREYRIEREWNFDEDIKKIQGDYPKEGYLVDVTDRCNLTCPHCYQEPDNKKKDKSIDDIVQEVLSYPIDGYPITLAGAEPTMRKDLCEMIVTLREKTGRSVDILTNGIMLEREDYVKSLMDAGLDHATIGLNHPDYQGQHTHDRQLKGIDNCIRLGQKLGNINYTIESLDQIPFILQEIDQYKDHIVESRIRGGADIGRFPEDEGEYYLSDLVYEVYRQVLKLNYKWEKIPADDNIYHYTTKINDTRVRLIKWADAKTVDLDELRCPPWGSFVPGVPLTNLMHAVMLRDCAINKGMTLPDQVPEEYARR